MARVLVVDDEPRLVESISRALRARGFDVDGAYDGNRGLELAAGGAYGLVILDLRLPGRTGLEVLRGALRAHPEQQVIILSALQDIEAKVRCLEVGAADYLTKPFSLAELTARVDARLRVPAKRPERFLRVGRLVLDLRRRVADLGHGPVVLSPREFLLLQHLMRRPNEVCTRDELLEEVWGYSFDPGTNVVNVFIARLRQKLGADVVETVRSVGYALRRP